MNKTLSCLCLSVITGILPLAHADSERTMLVLDASGSMWGQLEGKTKIEIAREAMATLVRDWPEGREAGLVAYGHRKKGDCADIETLIPVGPLDAKQMTSTVNSLNPKGKTPLSAAVKQAAEALKFTEEKATVVLLSDGKETCDLDPCALGAELEKLGVDFTAHVIGFDVTKAEDQAGLRCLAENTGGQFIPASNTKELNAALAQTAKAPEPEPEPLPQATLIAPESAIKGTAIQVEVEAPEGLKGQIRLFAKGKEKSLAYGYVRAGDTAGYKSTGIRLPALIGDFELKWVTQKGKVIAEKPITLTEAEITLMAPESAIKGTAIQVEVDAPEGLKGQIKLFARGKKKSLAYGYVRAGDTAGYKPTGIRLPALIGDFELKWLTQRGEVIAEKPITLTEADITLLAPESAIQGTAIQVEVEAPKGLKGQIKLYAKGKKKSLAYNYVKAGDTTAYQPTSIRLPALTGEFELKWLTQKGEVIAEKAITITKADITLIAPESAIQGTAISVEFEAPEGLKGQIQLFAKGKKKKLAYAYVSAGDTAGYKPTGIRLPALTGDFELKWLTQKNEVIAEVPITLTEAEVALLAPENAPKGTVIEVELEAPDGLNGQIQLFAKGKQKRLSYGYVKAGDVQGYKPVSIRLPALTGDFELRWITNRREDIAATSIILDEIEVSLEAPEQAEKGTTIPITLNAPDGLDGRIYLYPKGKDKHIGYSYVQEADVQGYKSGKIKLPDVTGDYVLSWKTNRREVLVERAIQVVDEITE